MFSSVLSAIHVKGGMDAQKAILDSYRTLQMKHDTRNIPSIVAHIPECLG